MKAMILAAGYGKRMKALTRTRAKALMTVGEETLIEHMIRCLAKAGIVDIVINVSYLAEQIMDYLGDGGRYGVAIQYSQEPQPLEWGGGVLQALPLLGDQPFLAVSSDLWSDYPFDQGLQLPTTVLAHLVLVEHPHFKGDFDLNAAQCVVNKPRYTYSGMGIFSPQLFARCQGGKISFQEVLQPAIESGQVLGECYNGTWWNVGTAEILMALRQSIATQ